jgi:plasmid maintenance system killer protein
MKLNFSSPRVAAALKDAPLTIRRAFYKQAALLAGNLHHPSLRAKKYDEANDIWQARVNRDWRFYFMIVDDAYVILDVIPHPK